MTQQIQTAIERLDRWVGQSGWIGYDPFDGLSAPLARRFTFEVPAARIGLQQIVRRSPVNIRPLLGITKKHSTKAMGYFASAYLRLYQITGRKSYLDRALFCLDDLERFYSPGYSGYAWGNAFDYQSRGNYLPAGVPTVVWTSFIGYAFVDAYEILGQRSYLDAARSACEFIMRDLPRERVSDDSLCISYVPLQQISIHNANLLAASLLARVYRHTGEGELLELAEQSARYTAEHQRPDGSWWYGEGIRWRWVDGYHTGFVIDALHWYMEGSGDRQYEERLRRGMDYYRRELFEGVIPKHYSNSTYPIDVQPVAQAVQTFALIPETLQGDPEWATRVAGWTIDNMQDPAGYFYFRKHRWGVNKTPCLHWGQSTMLAALAVLTSRLAGTNGRVAEAGHTGDAR